jgi:predicted PurR-regulated permease PerM
MLLADPVPYRDGFIRLFPSFYRRRIDEILHLCDDALQGWLVGILFNMVVITVLSLIGLSILRVPLALAQAMLAGLLTFIPNIGPGLSVIPPIAIALLDAPWKSLAVLVVYFAIQQIESNFLTPVVMAQQVSLLPAITLLSQVFFATFFGFLGLFLSLPLTVVVQVWIKEVLIKDILDKWKSQEQPQIAIEKADDKDNCGDQ